MIKPTKGLWLLLAIIAVVGQIVCVFTPGREGNLLWGVFFMMTAIALLCFWEAKE